MVFLFFLNYNYTESFLGLQMETKPTYTSITRISYMADRPACLLVEVEVGGESIKCVLKDFNRKCVGWCLGSRNGL